MKPGPKPGAPRRDEEREYLISPSDFLEIIRRRLWVIALAAFVLAGAVTGYGLMRTPVYEASARILVSQRPADVEEGSGNLSGDVQGLQQLTQTVAEAVGSGRVAEGAMRELGSQTSPQTLYSDVVVEQVNETQFVDVFYRDPDPARASEVVNAIAAVSSDQISGISPSTAVTATVWEQASEPEVPVSPNLVRDGILALLFGAMLGLGLAFLLEYLDNSWRSPEEAEQVSGVPTFGIIPRFEAAKNKPEDKLKDRLRAMLKAQGGDAA